MVDFELTIDFDLYNNKMLLYNIIKYDEDFESFFFNEFNGYADFILKWFII